VRDPAAAPAPEDNRSKRRIVVWVQRFNDRPHLMLQWRDPDTGRRKSQSAGTSNRKEAERVRADLEYELNHGLHPDPDDGDLQAVLPLLEGDGSGQVVYFIRQLPRGPIKIGRGKDAQTRLARLQTGSPCPLDVIGVVPGGPALEAELHRLFARYRLHGEWFAPAPSLLRFIRQAGELPRRSHEHNGRGDTPERTTP
jgi:hypothetical protein